ncbi:MAG: hypothetical protein ABIZ81_07470 [Opitutaceae bacterium]
MKEIIDSIHADARLVVAKAALTSLAMIAQGILIGALFERFSG